MKRAKQVLVPVPMKRRFPLVPGPANAGVYFPPGTRTSIIFRRPDAPGQYLLRVRPIASRHRQRRVLKRFPM